ncbi:rhamnan synthesis F family protein [Methylobacterium sp. Leaf108]|uniref:rhamnan synthesis F family protein n=1 Tax=Methylobacterium sp. Leaf108 TaxID=1736256 RepID=UPI0006FFBA09|nr:rhamnan synthesis F family protein [Methylobacterium sp. Leaf108]KQP58146.1 hypothetical protein ASF39_18245 [Methylobacterium sp. Leaf108]
MHYLQCGHEEGRATCPVADPAEVALVATSYLFDPDWYRQTQAPDLPTERDPARHYLQDGAALGLSPGPLFDGPWYRDRNSDVAAAGMNPLVHYLQSGHEEGRAARPVADLAEVALVKTSDLFDPDWYRQTQAPDLPPERDPARHYLQDGAALGLSPGPLFDGPWYLDHNPDVAVAGTNPLVHYLKCGHEEGRPIRLACTRDAAAQRIETRPLVLRKSKTARIAIVVHAFYVDVFEEFLPYIVRAIQHFDLLVSTDTPAKRLAIEAAASRAGLARRTRVAVVENRGRNFGPVVTVFAQEILRCDYVLHVHTKKSLYSGNEQIRWRNDIYRTLFAKADCAHLALTLFEDDAKLGLFFPETSAHMPYWAHTWLANVGSGHELLGRLGLRYDGFDEYLDYPVGGMFWARTAALRPLLEAGFAPHDFPNEHGQTDGTLAHAIERAITLVCRSQGYDYVCFDYDRGLARYGSSARNWHQYSGRSQDEMLELLRCADLISFDLFDTLVCRPARRPDAVLKLIEHRISAETGGPVPLFEERRAAENRVRARKHYQGDVNLCEIYAELAAAGPIPIDVVERAHALERRIDLGCLLPRTEVIAILKAAHGLGKRVVLITDTYYKKADILDILQRVGVAELFAQVYVSNEVGARKDRGDLWSHVEEAEGVPRARWLHVGDNEHSDIQAACDRRIPFLHVAHPAKILAQSGFQRDDGDLARTWPTDLVIGQAMLKLTRAPFLDRDRPPYLSLASTRDIGFTVFGPIMLLFMSWLIRHAALALVDRLYFLAREGDFLVRVYRLIRERYGLHDLPEGRYFHVSRQTAIAAALAIEFRPELVTSTGDYTGDLRALLRNRTGFVAPAHLGLDRFEVALDADASVVERVMTLLEPEITEHAGDMRARFLAYARQEGFDADEKCAVVDVGYSATIQKMMQVALGRPLIGFYMATFDAASAVEKGGGFAFGCVSENAKPWTSPMPALKYSLAVEAFLTAAHGQVVGYTVGDRVTPLFKTDLRTDDEHAVLAELHDGAEQYVRDTLDLYGPELLKTNMPLKGPQEFLRMLMEGQIAAPFVAVKGLGVEDDFCGIPIHKVYEAL